MSETTGKDPAYEVDSLIAEDIDAYLEQHQNKGLLRFITCGSVDDGKSTLIGRLWYDSKMISILPFSSTASRPSASRASLSMSPIASSRPKSASSSSPIRLATNNIPATW